MRATLTRSSKITLPFVGARLAGHDVEQRRFARAVGPDQEAQFAVVDREVEIVQHFEAVEADGDVVRRP